jgi:hypothetical protein
MLKTVAMGTVVMTVTSSGVTGVSGVMRVAEVVVAVRSVAFIPVAVMMLAGGGSVLARARGVAMTDCHWRTCQTSAALRAA